MPIVHGAGAGEKFDRIRHRAKLAGEGDYLPISLSWRGRAEGWHARSMWILMWHSGAVFGQAVRYVRS